MTTEKEREFFDSSCVFIIMTSSFVIATSSSLWEKAKECKRKKKRKRKRKTTKHFLRKDRFSSFPGRTFERARRDSDQIGKTRFLYQIKKVTKKFPKKEKIILTPLFFNWQLLVYFHSHPFLNLVVFQFSHYFLLWSFIFRIFFFSFLFFLLFSVRMYWLLEETIAVRSSSRSQSWAAELLASLTRSNQRKRVNEGENERNGSGSKKRRRSSGGEEKWKYKRNRKRKRMRREATEAEEKRSGSIREAEENHKK